MNLVRHGVIGAAWLCCLTVHADWPSDGQTVINSRYGQFTARAGRPTNLIRRFPDLKNDANLIQFDAPLLAVTADRARNFFWLQLGWPAGSPWTGKIDLDLHPAVSLDDPVQIMAHPFAGVWNYRVDLPDLVSRSRFAHALAGVVLLERANARSPVDVGSATVPAWLVDGLARQLLADDDNNILLGKPGQVINHLAQTRQVENRHARDPLAGTRRVLQLNEALTFNQLSWPTDDQLAGNDDGDYYASAQLFVNQLLARKNGPAKMRAFLGQLPAYMNWQTAFFAAFHEDFTRPLEVEKWWSLQVVGFTERDPGPRWTLAASHDKLDSLLVVPAEFRTATNALPEMRDISLQEAIRTIPPDALAGVLENRLRDLQLAQMRLALPYVMLAREYSTALADFLGEPHRTITLGRASHVVSASPAIAYRQAQPAVLKRLSALDTRRRQLAGQLKLNVTER